MLPYDVTMLTPTNDCLISRLSYHGEYRSVSGDMHLRGPVEVNQIMTISHLTGPLERRDASIVAASHLLRG